MFVANVGDSRAIVCAQHPGEESTVRPLSVDQTPFRKDERERIKKAGGHVLTIDQIEGLEVRGEVHSSEPLGYRGVSQQTSERTETRRGRSRLFRP